MATGTIPKIPGVAYTIFNKSHVSTSATFASTGESFTLGRPALVRIDMTYGSGRPIAIGVKWTESDTSSTVLLNSIDPSAIENTAGIGASGYLEAGTYYIWCKTSVAGYTSLTVYATYL